MKIVLGSKSPRRFELMTLLGFDFVVDAVDIDENIEGALHAKDYVKKITLKKAIAIHKRHPNSMIICADTIVVSGENILEKPANKDDARNMIKVLSGNYHYVYTAVAVFYHKQRKTFIEKTKVYVDTMTLNEIESYIKTEEPYDKAGGYAIQGSFGKYIKKIEGDYYNVVGLPLNRLYRLITEIKKSES